MHYDLVFRLIAAAQLLAVAAVRAYFGAPGAKESLKTNLAHRAEPIWLTTFLGLIALLHFGAIFVYLANPIVLRWSSVENWCTDSSARNRAQLFRSAWRDLGCGFDWRKLQPNSSSLERARSGHSRPLPMDQASALCLLDTGNDWVGTGGGQLVHPP